MSAKLDSTAGWFGFVQPKPETLTAAQLAARVLVGFNQATAKYFAENNIAGLAALCSIMAGSVEAASRGVMAAKAGASGEDILRAMAGDDEGGPK